MEQLLTAVAVFSLALIAAVLASLRREHIRVEYSVSWLVAGVVLFALSRLPRLITSIGEMLGVDDEPVVLLILVLSVFLVVFFRFSILISQLKDANIALTQKIAILEHHLDGLRNGR
jgi:hypothetical protein